MSEPVAVLGAQGGIGSAVVAELAARGTAVRAVGRHTVTGLPHGAEPVVADVATPDGARAAVKGAGVVYHCAQPPYHRWREEFPPLNRAVVDACAAAGAKLVFADNLYLYGPPAGPLREDMPAAATGHKGRLRATLAGDLLAAHEAGRLRVAIGRASDYFGPGGVASALGETFFGRLVAGKKARWLGRVDQPHAVSYLPDVARGLVTLGTNDVADGRAWHLPAKAVTGQRLTELVGKALGREAGVSPTPAWLLKGLGTFNPMMRELVETTYQWERPWVVDGSAYESTFGPLPVTPLDAAVGPTVDWWQQHRG